MVAPPKAIPALDEQLAAAVRDPRLMRAGAALHTNDLPVAERLLKAHLTQQPFDVSAMRMLAEVAARLRRYDDAERLLARAIELQPGFRAARLNYASVLHRGEKIEAATQEIEGLLADDPDDPAALAIAAAIRVRRGDFDQAIDAYRRVLDRNHKQPRLWMSLGHVFKTVGRQVDAVAAYRQAIAHAPQLGEAWWSLANLKTLTFSPDDVDAMTRSLEGCERIEDRYHLRFALGKAHEDLGNYAQSFAHYLAGNNGRRALLDYDPVALSALVDRSISVLTADVFEARSGGGGDQAADPIFIVGLPRSGSTLIEQILASHPLVEGTAELPHIPAIVRQLVAERTDDDARYIDVLLRLSAEERTALGQQYLDRASVQRKTDRPRFIDKLPNNFAHIGLIKLILPNATIIDARRHMVATCFSCFKQHFARGQEFTYDLSDLARYYTDYARLLDHYDRVLPGAIHRVEHETLIDDPRGTIQALLAACGLDFHLACLQFHRTERPVRTASSEQVRKPLNRDGIDQWRHYRPWLNQLIAPTAPRTD